MAAEVLILPFDPEHLPPYISALYKHSPSLAEDIAHNKRITIVHRPAHWQCKTLVLWPQASMTTAPDDVKTRCSALCQELKTLHFASLTLYAQAWEKLTAPKISKIVNQIAMVLLTHHYAFTEYKTQATPPPTLAALAFAISATPEINQCISQLHAMAAGAIWYRDIANQPANVCTPEYLAQQALWLDEQYVTITTQILDETALAEANMHTYLAVNRGSALPTSMPIMHYHGAADNADAPLVLIGKGVTFDTGGITIKGADKMAGMIYDMCGAACVLGVMKAVAELELPLNIIAILATAENHVDGNAYRPGDIYPTRDGKTVEIISTDAEGRLLLCEALSYAKQFQPCAMIDLATLTGAAIVSLGNVASGLMSNNQVLADALIEAGQASGDYVWQFPLWDEYAKDLESEHADLRNSGRNSPGMITAGMFLKAFVDDIPWAHLDIAGTSFDYGTQNSTTGRPLYLLLEYLFAQALKH